MTTAEEEVRLSMRVMINKEKTKVLFALVDNKLADILLSFLTLPLGVIPRLLKNHYGDDEAPNIGCLNTLYNGLENLDSSNFRTEGGKLMLLNPKSSPEVDCSKLKFNINDTQPVKYFNCGDCKYGGVIMYHDTERCPCGKSMKREVGIGVKGQYEDGEVLTVKTSYFLISDDLRVLPNVTGSFLQSIKDLGITDTDGAKEMTITIGFNQIMDLLKGSLLSQTPLSDLILQQRPMHHPPIPKSDSEPFTLMAKMEEEATSRSKKMKVKATIQKSTQKLVFVQAEEDFIDFLFSFLIIPLGQVEKLLGSNTCLGSIDNMYKSLANLNADKYLKTPDVKGWLLDPEIPPNYLSKNQIFPISEEIYYFTDGACVDKPMAFVYPNNEGSYLKGPGMFMVTDDLTVTPLCMLSTISTLNELKIPLCDVEELEIDIGLEEGLRILKASLTSTCALTNGLNPVLEKQLKRKR